MLFCSNSDHVDETNEKIIKILEEVLEYMLEHKFESRKKSPIDTKKDYDALIKFNPFRINELNFCETEYVIIKKEIEFYKNKQIDPSVYPQYTIDQYVDYFKYLAIQSGSYSN